LIDCYEIDKNFLISILSNAIDEQHSTLFVS